MSEEAEKDPAESNTPEGRAKRLTSDQWARIETLWEIGVRTKEIENEFKVSGQAVTSQMRKRGIIKGSKVGLVTARQGSPQPSKPSGPISDFEAKRKERIERTKETAHVQSHFIWSQTTNLFKEINAGHRTMAGSKAELQALKLAGQVIDQNIENSYKVLDIEHDINEQDLPTLVFEDLTKEEIRVIQEGSEEDLDSLDLPEPDDDDNDIIEEGQP